MLKFFGLLLLLGNLSGAQVAFSKPRILVVGDSLTEGYNVPPQSSYPALLQAKLRSGGFAQATVVNAGTSGATSAFGVRTLKFQLKHQVPDFLILALGANDGLRGVAVHETKKNLSEAISLAQSKGVKVILAGMLAPPNYGRKFPQEFRDIFPELAKKHKVKLIPFLLDGVAGEPELNLADGIHPNEKGYQIVAENVYKVVKGVIEK